MAQPAPTVFAPGIPYTVFDNRLYWLVPTVVVTTAPTLAELNAGKDVTSCVGAVSGFAKSTASLDLPRAGTKFTGNLPGRQTAADSSLTFYLDIGGVDIRTIVTEGGLTNVVIVTEGNTSGAHLSVWPVRTGSIQIQEDLEAVAMAEVQFYTYKTPAEFVVIPSA